MKKLLTIVSFLFSFSAFGQIEAVNPEHLFVGDAAGNTELSLPVQRIKLTTGVELEYVEQGPAAGVPVVFLHGITDSWHSFESTLKFLPSSLRAFALSQRGHGDSERPLQGYTPKHFAADVAAFVRQKKLGPVVIVGHSMGGVNAQQFALDYPQLTKALVVLAADPVPRQNAGMEGFHKEVMQLKGALSYEFMDGFQKATLTKSIDSAYYRVLVVEGTKVPARVFQAAFSGMVGANFLPRLHTLRCPVLIAWGDKDSFFLKPGQDLLASGIKQAKLLLYEGAGHAFHWEEPQRVAADLAAFIKTLNQ